MELVEKILGLKRKRNAVILAHNYQTPAVQDIADYVGDSLGLSVQAAGTDAEVIVFCGVRFMAETAKILSPEKTVLLPDERAGCPMADMVTTDQLMALKAKHPEAKVLAYVNTSAQVKAECDLCCTSANAVSMVRDILKDEKEIIFIPDRHLADYVALETGREFIVWNGWCPTHAKILPEDIIREKELHPKAFVIAHPECPREVRSMADEVASTGGMCSYIREKDADEFIVATEVEIIHRLKKENPEKLFYPASRFAVCPNMKYTTLEKILWSLEDMTQEVHVDESVRIRARRSIGRMLSAGERQYGVI
ncbi:MAG: quinolinate synthase NadA [Syntrophales bacterium]|nr:quinolinate synthase NadA [Syntrophales bacterium]